MKNFNGISIELATFGLVAQYHNRLLRRVPYFGGVKTEIDLHFTGRRIQTSDPTIIKEKRLCKFSVLFS